MITHSQIDRLALSKDKLWGSLIKWNVLFPTRTCPKCFNEMKLVHHKSSPEGRTFICYGNFKYDPKKRGQTCTRVSVRTDTFCEKAHIQLYQLLHIILGWTESATCSSTTVLAKVSRPSCAEWFTFCRENSTQYCLNNSQEIGGPDKTVEIAKCEFNSNKYYGANDTVRKWIFVGVEKQSSDFFMAPVENLDADTFISVIKKFVRSGSLVTSDVATAYGSIAVNELSINHAISFIRCDNEPIADTMKDVLQRERKRRKPDCLADYLSEFLFLNKCRQMEVDPFIEIIETASKTYLLKKMKISGQKINVKNETTCELDKLKGLCSVKAEPNDVTYFSKNTPVNSPEALTEPHKKVVTSASDSEAKPRVLEEILVEGSALQQLKDISCKISQLMDKYEMLIGEDW